MAEQTVESGVFPVDGKLAALRVPGEPALALQVPADAAGDGRQDGFELGHGWRRHAVELEAVMAADVYPVQHQQLAVDSVRLSLGLALSVWRE